jgi:hypothetical protein
MVQWLIPARETAIGGPFVPFVAFLPGFERSGCLVDGPFYQLLLV